jgi:hypothetical protein
MLGIAWDGSAIRDPYPRVRHGHQPGITRQTKPSVKLGRLAGQALGPGDLDPVATEPARPSVVLLAALELDLAGAFGAGFVGLAAGQLLLEDRGRDDADLVDPGGQFLEGDALLDGLDALDVGDLLGTDLDDDLLERVILGPSKRSSVSFGRIDRGFLGRIRRLVRIPMRVGAEPPCSASGAWWAGKSY